MINLIKEKRPELKERMVNGDNAPTFPFTRLDIDFARVEEVLGLKKDEFHALEDTFLGAIDDIVALEKQWKDAGYTVAVPLTTSE